jgi:hypothetical protein
VWDICCEYQVHGSIFFVSHADKHVGRDDGKCGLFHVGTCGNLFGRNSRRKIYLVKGAMKFISVIVFGTTDHGGSEGTKLRKEQAAEGTEPQ